MVKNLRKYILVLIGMALLSNVALAQVEKGKSRLDIGKKPATKAPAQKLSYVGKPMPKEVKLDKPTVVNQYFRNALLNGSSKPAVVKTTNTETLTASTDRNVGNSSEPDKLFSNDKITVSNIYPNPANDFATIDYSITGNINDASMSFYNLLGNEVGSFELDKSDRKLKVQTTNWDSGVYLYQLVIDGKKVVTKKLLVRHN
ncbi:T9SS type A sorting domain-containing protein [Emticicia sp. BO119]|uniref:T9SS type A sorting domain-containing protein n=1 Tax=Emticicia sp. BO119 TaxID=2757768 RepID=UPI0015F10984|nr:T9SS type A sorting domain-containing protein [Emticicia sp. BO119]MBA4852160.1 T9SS type A sorting domain-containing protein [Emticicia sp. BO119]